MSEINPALENYAVTAQNTAQNVGQAHNTDGDFQALITAEQAAFDEERHKVASKIAAVLSPEQLEGANALRELHEKMRPIHQKIGAAFNQIRKVFADAGMELVDMIQIKKTQAGEFVISGWGIGETVSHPQGNFLNAVFNGQEPSFAEESEKIASLIDKIEGWHSEIQDLKQENSELLSEPFVRQASIFDHNVGLGAVHLTREAGPARELVRDNPVAFENFRSSLDDELEKLTNEQVLSRFYFEMTTKPDLPDELLKYFT